MSEHNYEYDELVQIGQQANQLLRSQVFSMAYGAVLEDLQRQFFNTPPGHTKTLEEIRREGNALAKVVSKLNESVTVAEQILTNQQNARGEG